MWEGVGATGGNEAPGESGALQLVVSFPKTLKKPTGDRGVPNEFLMQFSDPRAGLHMDTFQQEEFHCRYFYSD